MLEFLIVLLFVWFLMKAIGLAMRITWGLAKVVATLLMVIAVPLLVICFMFVGGLTLLVPVVLVGAAVKILDNCV